MEGLEFPSRYEPLNRLGKGGGGEVWAVRDRYTRERLALKVLAADATESEMSYAAVGPPGKQPSLTASSWFERGARSYPAL